MLHPGRRHGSRKADFFEPQGESNVQDSTNVHVEHDYGVSDSDITHTEIDCPLFERSPDAYATLFGSPPDLYARVAGHVAPLFVVAPVPSLGPPGLAVLLVSGWRAALRSTSRSRISWEPGSSPSPRRSFP